MIVHFCAINVHINMGKNEKQINRVAQVVQVTHSKVAVYLWIFVFHFLLLVVTNDCVFVCFTFNPFQSTLFELYQISCTFINQIFVISHHKYINQLRYILINHNERKHNIIR